jgi:putative adhesin
MLREICVTATLAVLLAPPGLAQSRNQGFGRSSGTRCDDSWNDRRASHCEIREETISGLNPLDIDAGQNGGIRVRGWDRTDVLVRAKIVAQADTDAEARRLVAGVRVDNAGGRVRAEGPDNGRRESWSVSFDLQVPRAAILTLNTKNGGISIDDFRGVARFRAVNGGVSLSNIGGDVRGETTNGGLNLGLGGDRWDGPGLDVETSNGGIRMTLPAHYSATLETGTINGGVNIDFPIAVQGTIGRHITTTLGAGGAKVRAMTTNGGVTVRRR